MPSDKSFRDLVAACGGAVMIGAAIGALSFAVVAFQSFKTPMAAIGGAIVGAVLGGFSGLDSALPVPRRRAGERAAMGPFRSGASFAFAALAFVGLSFYLSGRLTLECARASDGVRCSRVTTGWFNSAETSRTEYGPIKTAYEGGTNQIVVAMPSEERNVIDGFDAAAVSELQGFLKSSNPTLVVRSRTLAWMPFALWAIAAAIGLFGAVCLRSGVKQLRAVLATPSF